MSQPGAQSRVVLAIIWLALGAALIATGLGVGLTRWRAILSGHPALIVVTIAALLVGLLGIIWAVASLLLGDANDRRPDPHHPDRPTSERIRDRARWRIVLAVPALALGLVLLLLVAGSRPYQATPAAVAALQTSAGVRVAERISWYELVPTRRDDAGRDIKPTTALVFVPGARVDSRAYASLLRPLAEAGFLVAVLKEPFGFALADRDHPQTVIDVHPEIASWAVGGHSLGGVAAASWADDSPQVEALVLWASYPARALDRQDLLVWSVSGANDGLTTPEDIAESKAKLPPSTTYVVVPEAVHSDFGDYGVQSGDNQPTGDRAAHQAAITAATQAALAAIVPPPPPK